MTWVPGHSACTASASTCAASCRISSSARGSSRLTNSILASCEIGSLRSATTPSSAIATVRLASDGEMPFAISSPVMSLGNSRLAPSGKVRAILFTGSAGLRFVRLYWNPDAGVFWSGILVSPKAHSCERAQVSGSRGIAGDSAPAIGQNRENPVPPCAVDATACFRQHVKCQRRPRVARLACIV